ncbi:MAG: hypothetical protein JWM80_365 [Cyanobacteria bacterium RYN_339]|nr:hypothetical protein [Cyanobacteria bacterium RYN_339]
MAVGAVARTQGAKTAFQAEFGNQSYLQDGSNPTLLTLVGAVVDRAPQLANSPLAQHVAAGHLGPDDIKQLQAYLSAQGHPCGPTGADGKYGPNTHAALMGLIMPSVGPAPTPAPPQPPAPAPAPGPKPAGPAVGLAALPPRPADAEGGQAFLDRTAHLSRAEREDAIFQEIAKGNVPDFLRQLKDVNVSIKTADGRTVNATYHVMPDYLAVGSNQDFVRMPMDPITAQRLAERFGCTLPTRKMVDDVYHQATVKLTPSPLPAGPQMMSNDYYRRHQEAVERQRQGLQAPLGELTAGDKKDLIISNAIGQHPGKVIIYGWHQPNGKPIQPLSWIHEASYADYSHGARLVSGTMTVDGREVPVADVLADPQLSRLLSDEGAIKHPGYPTP